MAIRNERSGSRSKHGGGAAARASLARRLAFFMIACALVLGSAEAAWRLLVPVSEAERQSTQFLTSSLYYLGPCAVLENAEDGPVIVGQLTRNTGGDFRVPLRKTSGVRRIAFVGESTSVQLAGAAVNLFAESPDAAAWELMNCGESGSTLEHVARHTTEVLGYHPDVLVVMFGHNWRMPAMPLDPHVLRLELAMMQSRLVAGLSARLRPPTDPPPLDLAQRLARLETFLRETARAAHAQGVAVIFATATANLWFPPLIEESELAEPEYLTALLDWTGGRQDQAVDRLSDLAAAAPHPYWDFLLGTWLSRRGDAAGALGRLRKAVDEEKSEVDRATSAVNEIIRRVAREEGAGLRDSEREMERVAAGGAPGWDVMRDHCHLQPRYVADEARALLELAADATGGSRPRFGRNPFADDDVIGWMLDGLATIQSQVRGARARRMQRALAYFVESSLRARPVDTLARIQTFLDGTVFGLLPGDQRAAVLVSIADGLEWGGLHDNALTLNTLALAAQSSTVDLGLLAAGTSGAAIGRVAPDLIYDHASEVGAWMQLGLLRFAGGDARAAADAFRRAGAIPPPRPDAAFLAEQVETSSKND